MYRHSAAPILSLIKKISECADFEIYGATSTFCKKKNVKCSYSYTASWSHGTTIRYQQINKHYTIHSICWLTSTVQG